MTGVLQVREGVGGKGWKAAAKVEEIVGEGFSVAKFVENFEVLVDAEGGIKRLRELTIELAAQGLLSGAADISSWKRLTLGDVVIDLQNGISKRQGDNGTAVPVLRLADIDSGTRLREHELREIVLTDSERQKYLVSRGDILVIRVNGSADLVARFIPCTTARAWAYSDHLIRARLHADVVDAGFLCAISRSAGARAHLTEKTVTTAGQKTINQVGLGGLPLLLPPLAEQKRIVAKVDQLMALCDELEARQTKKRETGARLTKAALEALTTAEGPEEFEVAWRRVVENFDTVVDRAEKVGEVRRAVLELAATGRLVAPVADSVGAARAAVEGGTRVSGPILEHTRPSEWSAERGWLHVPLGATLQEPLANGRSVPDDPAGFPVLRLSALRGRFLDFAERKLGAWTAEQAAPFVVQPGDVLFVRGNGAMRLVGRACMAGEVPEPVAFPDTAIRARLRSDVLDTRWLWYVWESRVVRSQIEARAKTTAGIFKVSQDALYAVRLPVPTLSEQRRIVAKVDRLMGVCDDLEAHLRRAEDCASKLVEAVVQEMVA